MKIIRLLILPVLLLITGCDSFKSDSDKMIEKCNDYTLDLILVQTKSDWDAFNNKHPYDFLEFYKALHKDSIYANQNLDKAMPHIFEAMYMTYDKMEKVVVKPSSSDDPLTWIIVFGMRKLGYCTQTSQIDEMVKELNRETFRRQYSQYSLNLGNSLIEMAIRRKKEIQTGNLYNSEFLYLD